MTLELLGQLLSASLGVLIVILALSFLVETLVEWIFGTIFDKIPALAPHKWALMYIAIGVGILGAFIYRFDLLAILGEAVGADPKIDITWYGITITGGAIGKGSNYLHDFIVKHFPPKK